MTEPSNYPEWASSPTAGDVVEPLASKKQSGWRKILGVPEKPPYQQFNWWMNNVWLWIKHFKEEAVTFTGLKTFSNGIATDTISEKTSAAGVTIDGVLLKDGFVKPTALTPSISNGASTAIMAVGSYELIEIFGVLNVVRSSGGNHNVSYKVRATKNAAGTWLVSDEFSEEILYTTLPVWDVSGGNLQVTMPTVTNFTSASFKWFAAVVI